MNTIPGRRRFPGASSPIHLAGTVATRLPRYVQAYLVTSLVNCCRPALMLVDRAGGRRQHLERAQPLGLRLAMHACQQCRHPGGRPDSEPFANIRRRPGEADGVDERIGHPADRLELLAAEVEVLERARIVGEAVASDEVVVEVLRF